VCRGGLHGFNLAPDQVEHVFVVGD
jgi:hypothetical protein